jgi:hypothetical protein
LVVVGALLDAVREEVEVVGRVVGGEVSASAELAVAMAREVESDAVASAKASCGKVLLEALVRLHSLVPAEREQDVVDELASRRLARLEAAKGAPVKAKRQRARKAATG